MSKNSEKVNRKSGKWRETKGNWGGGEWREMKGNREKSGGNERNLSVCCQSNKFTNLLFRFASLLSSARFLRQRSPNGVVINTAVTETNITLFVKSHWIGRSLWCHLLQEGELTSASIFFQPSSSCKPQIIYAPRGRTVTALKLTTTRTPSNGQTWFFVCLSGFVLRTSRTYLAIREQSEGSRGPEFNSSDAPKCYIVVFAVRSYRCVGRCGKLIRFEIGDYRRNSLLYM